MTEFLPASRALWNRLSQSIDSDEAIAQILDRGTMTDWRHLYRRTAGDARLRTRVRRIVLAVPLPLRRFWLAVLAALGEPVDLSSPVPDYYERTAV